MSKPKFKVGDRVRVRTDLVVERQYGGLTWWNSMSKTTGLVSKITAIDTANCICVSDSTFIYSPEMLEPAKPETIVIYRDGQKVIALDKRTGKRAEARCNPSDEFNFVLGAQIAFSRLHPPCHVDYVKPKPRAFTGKAVYLGGFDEDFTKGKIYEFNNGKVLNNDGDTRPVNGDRFGVDGLSLSDWNFLRIIE